MAGRYGILGMILVVSWGVGDVRAEGSVAYPGPAPGEAEAAMHNEIIVLNNGVIEGRWSAGMGRPGGGRLRPVSLTNKHSGMALPLGQSECFQLLLPNGQTLKASDLRIVRTPDMGRLQADPKSLRPGARNAGVYARVTLAAPDDLMIQWRVELRDGSNYIRQYVSLVPDKENVEIREIALVQVISPTAEAAGILDGSPVTAGDMFFAFEHPLSQVRALGSEVQCSLPRSTPVKAGEEQTYSSVMGVAPAGQLRRAFLYYVERERAQPYRPFLHYNSWYDLGYGLGKIMEADA